MTFDHQRETLAAEIARTIAPHVFPGQSLEGDMGRLWRGMSRAAADAVLDMLDARDAERLRHCEMRASVAEQRVDDMTAKRKAYHDRLGELKDQALARRQLAAAGGREEMAREGGVAEGLRIARRLLADH